MTTPAIPTPLSRPLSLTIVCWILIGLGVVLTIFNIQMLFLVAKNLDVVPNQERLKVQFVVSFISLTLCIVCGLLMLRGLNWARLLFVGWGVLVLLLPFAPDPVKFLLPPGQITFVLVVVFLFTPKANAFFSNKEAQPAAEI